MATANAAATSNNPPTPPQLPVAPAAAGGATNNSNNNNNQHPQLLPTPPPPAIKDSPTTAVSSRQPETPSSTHSDVILIPSYSRWFSWSNIHECEARFLPEFFDGRSGSKNPRVYRYYRNSIIQRFRENPTRKITFTEARKTIIGDVGSVRRVFDFLEAWGLINYLGAPSSKPHKLEDKEITKSISSNSNATAATAASMVVANDSGTAAAAESAGSKKRLCGLCNSVCTIACFARDKDDTTLCARCFVRGNYKVGPNSSDFRRVEISDEVKTDWTDKETLHLLEAVMHFRDDWKRVADHVGGRSARECVAHFVKLPFGEQFIGPPDSVEFDDKIHQSNVHNSTGTNLQDTTVSPTKRMRLNPLADASNPIMAQAAFLSALVGVEVAEAAARAAVWALYEGYEGGSTKESLGSLGSGGSRLQEPCVISNSNATANASVEAIEEAQLQLKKEEDNLEQAISRIQVQIKEIQDKIIHFEELDLQMEKESQQLEQLKKHLFVDQLTLLFHKAAASRSQERVVEDVKAGEVS